MILVYNHKIGRKGIHSLDVILPAIWAKSMHLVPGDTVRIEILGSGDLLIGMNRN